MRLEPRAIAMLLLVPAVSCGGPGGPELVVDRTACGHCGMLISEPAYAAAFALPDEQARVFDDVACLLAALEAAAADGAPTEAAAVWVHAYEEERWLAAAGAAFVRSASFRTPMGGGVVALSGLDAARRLAERVEGEVIEDFGLLTTVVARSGGRG